LVLVFLVVGAVAILYAEGWRAKLNPLAFDKVGGIYVRILPEDANVYIDQKLVKKTGGLFDRGTLLKALFPGTYELSIQKDGYQPWNESVPVAASLVTSRARTILVPEKGSSVTTTAASYVYTFGNVIVFSANNHIYRDNALLPGNKFLAATDDGQKIITASGTTTYYLTDSSAATSTPLSRVVPRINTIPRGPTTFSAIPENSSLFLAHSSSSLRLINVITGQLSLLEATSTTAFTDTPARVAWTSYDATAKHSVISLYDLLSGTFLRSVDFVPGNVKKLAFGDRDTLYALSEDGNEKVLYQVDLASGSRLKLANQAYDFEVATDGSTLALVDKEGLSIFESQSTRRYLFFRVPNPSSIQKITWYSDRAHLLIGYKDRVAFLSFGDTTLENLKTIAPSSEFAYDRENNIVYALKEGVLTRFEMPE
jgi:hypothetical protein